MVGSQLPNSFNMAYVEEVKEFVDSKVQVKELAQVKESHHHTNRVLKTLSRSTPHGADYLLEEIWHGKVNPFTK